MKKFAILLAFLTFVAACSDDDDNAKLEPCTTNVVSALNVLVTNEANEPVVSGITVTATDGDFSEQLQLLPVTSEYTGVSERAGTYVISIAGDDYIPYVSDPIVIKADRCHVINQKITVQLTTD